MQRFSRIPYAILLLSLGACFLSKSRDSTPVAADPGVGADASAPTLGSAIVFSSVSTSAIGLSWGAATDGDTATADLNYKVVSSTSDNVNTVATAAANGTTVLDWTKAATSTNATGLSASTTYYFGVLVKDATGNTNLYTGSHATLCTGKVIFMADVTNGAMAPGTGADALAKADNVCNSNKPTGLSGSTFKAMIWSQIPARYPCTVGATCTSSHTGASDWPVPLNSDLCSSDFSTRIATANADGKLDVVNALTSTSTLVFVGMRSGFTNNGNGSGLPGKNSNCSVNSSGILDWTSTSSSNTSNQNGSALAGNASVAGDAFWFNGSTNINCNSAGKIYCIEQ